MGISVKDQVDTKQYFSLSNIDPERMKFYNINLSIRQLKEVARKSPEFTKVPTGDVSNPKHQALTKIYRYEDFRGLTSVQG